MKMRHLPFNHSHFYKITITLIVFSLLTNFFIPKPGLAEESSFDGDPVLKPLVDTSGSAATQSDSHDKGDVPVSWQQNRNIITPPKGSPPLSTQAPLVLNGKIESLQSAIELEKDKVDWYAWYLSVRKYLAKTGGLPCMLGTPIKFYRNGVIQALTPDPTCQASLMHRRFPLPNETRLEAVILPVRRGSLPPATPTELYTRIRE